MRWCSSCRKVRYEEEEVRKCPDCDTAIETLNEESFLDWEFEGRYRVTRLIGRGGMGAVYEGEQIRLGRKIAIKVLMPKARVSESIIKRFDREARFIAKLKHPNIVEIIDFDETKEGIPFMVMEYLEGRSLRKVIKEIPAGLDIPRFLLWMDEICIGLDAAHEAGVLHRDLKPENIHLVKSADGTEHARILDFGLAKMAEAPARTTLTQEGMLIGTPYYISPEQIRQEKIDVRADVYSLGVIAYEMVSGFVPFFDENAMAIIRKHLVEPPPDLRKKCPSAPEHIAVAINRALVKEREQRWPSVMAFRDALHDERLSSGPEVTVEPDAGRQAGESRVGDTAPTIVQKVKAAEAGGSKKRPPARMRKLIIIVVVLIVAVLAAIAVLFGLAQR
ncbi:MAG: serine/threonine-protein kinase [Pseudomonadota bacterium]